MVIPIPRHVIVVVISVYDLYCVTDGLSNVLAIISEIDVLNH